MLADERVKKTIMDLGPTPQPHFIPGYTGFCPDLNSVVGASYARATNEILKQRPEIAGRLVPTETRLSHPERVQKTLVKEIDKEKRMIKSRQPAVRRKVLNDYMIPGYGGHVPNNKDSVGVSFSKGCVKSISKFIKRQEELKEARSV